MPRFKPPTTRTVSVAKSSPKNNFGFVFSDDIRDWQPKTQTTKSKEDREFKRHLSTIKVDIKSTRNFQTLNDNLRPDKHR